MWSLISVANAERHGDGGISAGTLQGELVSDGWMSRWLARLSPLDEAQLSVEEQARLRFFQFFTLLVVIVPFVAETSVFVAKGQVSPTLSMGLALVAINASNYAAFWRHKNFRVAAWVCFLNSVANFLVTASVTGGLNSPTLIGVMLTLIPVSFVLGAPGVYAMIGLSVVGTLGLYWLSPGEEERLVFHLMVTVCMGLILSRIERARDEVRKRHDELLYLVEQSSDLIGVRRGMQVIYHNPAFVELTGKDPLRHDYGPQDFHPPAAVERLLNEAIPHAIEHGTWTGETEILDREGRAIPMLQTISARRVQDGRISDGTTIMKDISVLKEQERGLLRAKEEAEEALRHKSQFLANMSHEIRTPMNGVLGMAELLKDRVRDDEGRELLSTLTRSGEHLLSIINDILDLSKLESDKVILERRAFSPHAIAQETKRLFESVAKSGENELILTTTGSELYVWGDEARYRQVIYNLLGNALKFTERGKVELKVALESESETVSVNTAVRDEGIGIAPDNLESIFRPFEQEDGSTARRFGGTGLGLSISSRLVALMGGEIEVKSAVGKGSEFSFSVCLEPAPAPIEQAKEPTSSLSSSTRVIVAEDNRINRRVIEGLLKKLGLHADFAENGQELLEAVHQRDYDIVLMDCHMPVMDGFQATEAILADEQLHKRPKIIALTASAMPEERERCLNCGMDDFLSKPVQRDELARALQGAVASDEG